ncbi:hypothetical protein FQN51_009007 [Onygenales sp. PD_10]|nr:hypothetical protein FQN51_009007 [Onygenales sp. PD_10]
MRPMLSLSAVVGAVLLSGAALSGDDIVLTSSGPITGHKSQIRPNVSEYLGIPYGQPPVNNLRFAAPVKFTSNKPFEALTFSPDCPQTPSKPVAYPNATDLQQTIVANFAGQNGNPQNEDCLKLNVWTKTTGKTGKPVLVWLHGGRFAAGSTNNPFYQGQYMADTEDVIVVSVGYRLNIFGFSGAPDQPQNVALLDQRLAIEWVRENIAGFGGDSTRITIFGQSAGGVAVDYHSYAYAGDPIARGLIPMSGTALSMKPNTMEQSTKYWYTASAALGCGDSGEVMGCMRSKSYVDILAAVGKVPPEPSKALPQPVFHPTIDGKIVFSDYETLSAQGKFAKLPILVGNTDYEAGYYRISAYAGNITLTDEEWDSLNLAGFTCAADRTAGHRAKHGVPVWRYRYYGEWPNSKMYPGSGAYHGTDVAQIFGTAEDVSGGVENTEAEREVSAYMMHAWAVFAADPKGGLAGMGWPVYSEEEGARKVISFAYDNDSKLNILPASQTDVGCEALGTDTSPAQGAF